MLSPCQFKQSVNCLIKKRSQFSWPEFSKVIPEIFFPTQFLSFIKRGL